MDVFDSKKDLVQTILDKNTDFQQIIKNEIPN